MPKNRRGRDVILAMNEMFRATRSAAAMAVEVSSLEAARRILAGKAEEKEAALLQAQRRARTAFDQKTFDGIVATMGVVNVRVVAGETYARVEGVSPIDPQQAVRVVEYLMTHVTLSSARDTLLALIAGGAIKQS